MCRGEGSYLLLSDVVGAFVSTVEEVDCLCCSGLLGGGLDSRGRVFCDESDILRRFLVLAAASGSAVSSWFQEFSVSGCEIGAVAILRCRGVDGILIDTCR